jgi:GNAT superfamily N-acetyltransferase
MIGPPADPISMLERELTFSSPTHAPGSSADAGCNCLQATGHAFSLERWLAPLQGLPAGGTIRKLWIAESDLYCDHLLRLDRQSRHARFGGTVSDEFVRYYVNGSICIDAVLHGFFIDGVLRGVAELRPVSSTEAEVALSIERAWWGQGVGSTLLAHTLLAARNRGMRRLHMICAGDNQRMHRVARKFDAELTFHCGSVIGEIELPGPTPLTMMQEIVADVPGWAAAILAVQSGLLRAWAVR